MLRVSNPAARHWKTGARDWLRVLEAGLAAPEGKRKPVFWGFVSGTDTLIQEAKKLGLDPRPFEAVAAVVYSWNHPYYIDEPLDRERLRAMFDTALAALPEIEEAIRRHEAKQWAELAPRPIVPVVLNGRTHTTNGAPPATTSLPEHTTNGTPPVEPVATKTPKNTKTRKHAPKGSVKPKLEAELRRLRAAGQWGQSARQIFEGAGVSEASRYRLLNEENGDDEVKEWLSRYKHRGLGKTPPSVDDL